MNGNPASDADSISSATVVVLLLSAVSTPLLFRFLGASAFGEYSLLLSVFALYMFFVNAGVTDGVRTAAETDRQPTNSSAQGIGFHFLVALALAIAGAVLLALAAYFGVIGAAFGDEVTGYVFVLALLVVAIQVRDVTIQTLTDLGLERSANRLSILDAVSFAVIALPLAALGFGVFGALAGHLLASILVSVVGLLVVDDQLSLSELFARPGSGYPAKTVVPDDSLALVLAFLLLVLYHIDIVLLYWFTDSAAVGTYRIALTLAESLLLVPLALQVVFARSTSGMWSQNRRRKLSQLIGETTRYTFLLTAVIAVGLTALADIVVPLVFGSAATSAVGPLLVLLPGAFGFALARPILAGSKSSDQLRYPVGATAGAVLLNVALALLLIPRYGVYGAAVATSISYGSMAVFHAVSARAVGFDPLVDARLGRAAVTVALATVPIIGLSAAITNQWLALVIVPPVGLCIFLGFSILVGAMETEEPFEVLATLPDPVGTAADAARQRFERLHVGPLASDWFQSLLLLVGLSLLVTGLFVGLFGSGIESLRF
ncbi:polysaccharide biosynthesis protein [Halostagnicola larsenii XH-48]|uniref:Polysaccharide biosynthesis protein n=1 Tax=Halostagnicola larsenii XH-48 TaxID=797299 RepID=W0JLZ8_9EURY|nr:lipopolysaccharide biosynthesis protein [Halostagnicola larsenii]AHF99750.1 polysaccharide biosynthesis protein [Halostagnicola larsenii XH-48]